MTTVVPPEAELDDIVFTVNCTGYDTSSLKTDEIWKLLYLIIIFVVGTIGNTLVICTIIMKKAVFKNANIFIMNLAFADLVV